VNSRKGLSLVIPAWNEEARLRATLDRYLPALESTHSPFEVVVVADGSTDRTVEVAQRYRSRGVRLITSSAKLGKGKAVLTGLQAASYEFSGFIDADGPVLPEDLMTLVKALENCDCAIASRKVVGSRIVIPRTLARRLLSRVWNLAARGLLLLQVRDTLCGAKFFRTSSLERIIHEVAVSDWAFDVSILFHIKEQGMSVREVPVTWIEKSGSKLDIVRDVPRMLIALVGIRIMSSPIASQLSKRMVVRARTDDVLADA